VGDQEPFLDYILHPSFTLDFKRDIRICPKCNSMGPRSATDLLHHPGHGPQPQCPTFPVCRASRRGCQPDAETVAVFGGVWCVSWARRGTGQNPKPPAAKRRQGSDRACRNLPGLWRKFQTTSAFRVWNENCLPAASERDGKAAVGAGSRRPVSSEGQGLPREIELGSSSRT